MLPDNSWGEMYTTVFQMMIAKLRVVLKNHEVLLGSLMHILDHSTSSRVDHLAI
jgi:hypothetical protein